MQAPATTELAVSGMTCANCARHVTEAIQGVAAVQSASVSLSGGAATVRWKDPEAADLPAVLTAIAEAGYEAKEREEHTSAGADGHRMAWQWPLILGLAVTVLLMLGEWIFNLGETPWFRWVAFALGAAVQVISGAQFYRGTWRQLKVGQSNMDTLVALGSTTAFGYSAWALLSGAGGHLYFMEAAAIISLISAGHWLEARVSDRAGTALRALMHLAPPTARRLSSPKPVASLNLRSLDFSKPADPAAETETEVPVSVLNIGDRIALRPGDRVPMDGTVLSGESAVDEAMLTGESAPVDKKSGSDLFAGTVNLNGRLIMRVTATGESTVLARIIAAVERAQNSRADIQRLGDRVSNVFVPVIILIALGAGLLWGFAPGTAHHIHDLVAGWIFWHAHVPTGIATGFIIAAAVLIVACPCAMGLATPAAIMAAANTAAKRGILIRDGVALEKAGRITAIVFDKTGTLTEGKPKVAAVQEFPTDLATDLFEIKLTDLAASLAALSNHPLSQAVAASSSARLPIKNFNESAGKGVKGLFPVASPTPHLVQLGSLNWLTTEGADCAPANAFSREWMGKGASVIGLTLDCRLVAVFALRDTLKPGVKTVMQQLGNSSGGDGLDIFIVSGDAKGTVEAIAAEIQDGLTSGRIDVSAEVRPEQKADFIKKLQGQEKRVAFVGDGINDAPALTQADLGIAVGRASDIAREAADIVLLKSDIEAVPEALGLARATLRTIKQNLFWAFFYNALGVPLAALGFISPIICAAAMGFSDLIVIGNALRLLRWRR